MPVNTVSRRFGISTLTSLRLFTRAPSTRIRSWLSARVAVLIKTCSLLAVGSGVPVWTNGKPGYRQYCERSERRPLGRLLAGALAALLGGVRRVGDLGRALLAHALLAQALVLLVVLHAGSVIFGHKPCLPALFGRSTEKQQLDLGPGGQLRAVGHDREAVALAERAGHVRALAFGRRGFQHAVRGRHEPGGEEGGAAVGGLRGHGEAPADQRG